MNIGILVAFVACFVGDIATAATSDEFYKEHLPSGVSIGISPSQLQGLRPKVINNPLSFHGNGVSNGNAELVEAPIHGQTPVAYWYRFKDNKLEAITSSLWTRSLPDERIKAMVLSAYHSLSNGFRLIGEQEILRSTGATNAILKAQLWEDENMGLQIYLVASNEELTIIVFNPKLFGKADFFVGPEKLKDFESQAKVIRESTSKIPTENPPKDVLSELLSSQGPINAATASAPNSSSAHNSKATIEGSPWLFRAGIAAVILVAVVLLVVFGRKTGNG